MAVLPKAIYNFSAIPVKILTDFFVEMEKLVLKYITKGKQLVKTILKKHILQTGYGIYIEFNITQPQKEMNCCYMLHRG